MSLAIGVLSIEELSKLTRKGTSEKTGADYYEEIEQVRQLWSTLIATIYDPSVSEKHVTAACNALCFVARKCSQSACDEVRNFSFLSETWAEAFAAARCAFATGKNKPALQVLDTLAYLAKANPNKGPMAQSIHKAATEMVKIVFNQQPKRSLKEACIVLYFFLRKLSDFMSFSDVLDQAFQETRQTFSRLCHGSGMQWKTIDHEPDSKWLGFALSLLMAIRIAESRSATLKLLSLLGTLSAPEQGVDLILVVNKAIDMYSVADETALGDVSQDVLPSILTNSDLYHTFLAKQTQKVPSTMSEVQVVLIILEFGKRQGFIEEAGMSTIVSPVCEQC